jgi:hypothetical protein
MGEGGLWSGDGPGVAIAEDMPVVTEPRPLPPGGVQLGRIDLSSFLDELASAKEGNGVASPARGFQGVIVIGHGFDPRASDQSSNRTAIHQHSQAYTLLSSRVTGSYPEGRRSRSETPRCLPTPLPRAQIPKLSKMGPLAS